QAGDNLLLLFTGAILQGDADNALRSVVDQLEVLDIALLQQDLRDGLLHVGRGDVHSVMLGVVRVADAGEHIRNGIRDMHESLPPILITGRWVSRYRRQGIAGQADPSTY